MAKKKKPAEGVCPFTGEPCSCRFAIPADVYAEQKASIDATIAAAEEQGVTLLHTIQLGNRLLLQISAEHGALLREKMGEESKRHFCVEAQIEVPRQPRRFTVPRQHFH